MFSSSGPLNDYLTQYEVDEVGNTWSSDHSSNAMTTAALPNTDDVNDEGFYISFNANPASVIPGPTTDFYRGYISMVAIYSNTVGKLNY